MNTWKTKDDPFYIWNYFCLHCKKNFADFQRYLYPKYFKIEYSKLHVTKLKNICK